MDDRVLRERLQRLEAVEARLAAAELGLMDRLDKAKAMAAQEPTVAAEIQLTKDFIGQWTTAIHDALAVCRDAYAWRYREVMAAIALAAASGPPVGDPGPARPADRPRGDRGWWGRLCRWWGGDREDVKAGRP